MTFQTRQTQNRVVEVYDFAGAINRSLEIARSLSSGPIRAAEVGLTPGGTMNPTAQVPAGAAVDLTGGAYAVAAVPTHFQAFNGVWIVGGERVSVLPKPTRAFEAVGVMAKPRPWTFWAAGGFYEATTNRLYRCEVISSTHDTEKGSRIDLVQSDDGGISEIRRVTIFSDAANPRVRAAAFTLMDGGRFGGVVSTGGVTRKQWFVYSDDWTNDQSWTWQAVEITGLTINHFVHGALMRGPSGAAGDWMVGTYAGTPSAKRLRTLDNGATWAETVLRDGTSIAGASPNPSEQTHIHIPGHGWVMLTRVEGTADSRNLHVSTSPDGLTYGPWVDTGVPLGANPVHAVYDGGQVHIALSYRSGFAGSVMGDVLKSITVPGAQMYSAPETIGDLPRVTELQMEDRGVGYIDSFRLPVSPQNPRGAWVHFLKMAESRSTLRGASSKLVRISQVQSVSQTVGNTRQLAENAGFGLARRGETVAETSAENVPFVDRWVLLNGTGAGTLSAQRVALTSAQRNAFRHLTHALEIQNAANTQAGIGQRFWGRDAREMASLLNDEGRVTARIYGFGLPPAMDFETVVNGGSAIPSPPGLTFPRVPATASGGWVAELEYSLGVLPVDLSAVTSVQFQFTTGGTSGQWNNCQIAGVSVWLGADPPQDSAVQSFEPNNRYLAIYGSGTVFRIASGYTVSTTAARFPMQALDMVLSPTMTASSVSDIIVETAAADVAAASISLLTATTFDPIAPTVTVTTSGLTGGQGCLLKLGTGASLRFDTNW